MIISLAIHNFKEVRDKVGSVLEATRLGTKLSDLAVERFPGGLPEHI